MEERESGCEFIRGRKSYALEAEAASEAFMNDSSPMLQCPPLIVKRHSKQKVTHEINHV